MDGLEEIKQNLNKPNPETMFYERFNIMQTAGNIFHREF